MSTSTGTGWAQLRQQARSLETQVSIDSQGQLPSKLIVRSDRNIIPHLLTVLRRS